MAKQNQNTAFWSELFKANLYKRNQGRLARQLTWVGVMAIVAFGTWTLSQGALAEYDRPIRIGVPLLLTVAAGWIAFRAVNYPRFADFLISVEAEIDKVSWSSWPELIRATIVVLCTMLFLGAVLAGYDFAWVSFFRWIGVLQAGDAPPDMTDVPPQ
jgi:preprotein translocase subunit SecE